MVTRRLYHHHALSKGIDVVATTCGRDQQVFPDPACFFGLSDEDLGLRAGRVHPTCNTICYRPPVRLGWSSLLGIQNGWKAHLTEASSDRSRFVILKRRNTGPNL